jgi:hypothetical protein
MLLKNRRCRHLSGLKNVYSFFCLPFGVCVSLTVGWLLLLSSFEKIILSRKIIIVRVLFFLLNSFYCISRLEKKKIIFKFFTISGLKKKKNSSRPWRHRHIVLLLLFDIYTLRKIKMRAKCLSLFSFFSYIYKVEEEKKMMMMGVNTKQQVSKPILFSLVSKSRSAQSLVSSCGREPYGTVRPSNSRVKNIERKFFNKFQQNLKISAWYQLWIDAGEWKWSGGKKSRWLNNQGPFCVDAVWRWSVEMMLASTDGRCATQSPNSKNNKSKEYYRREAALGIVGRVNMSSRRPNNRPVPHLSSIHTKSCLVFFQFNSIWVKWENIIKEIEFRDSLWWFRTWSTFKFNIKRFKKQTHETIVLFYRNGVGFYSKDV